MCDWKEDETTDGQDDACARERPVIRVMRKISVYIDVRATSVRLTTFTFSNAKVVAVCYILLSEPETVPML